MKDLEKIAYHLYVRGNLSKREIKGFIREGYVNYYGFYLYDPVEKELSSIGSIVGKKRGWEYENWEEDYAPKEKVVGEFLDILESRTRLESEINLNPGLTRKPRIVEAPPLERRVRAALDKGRGLFSEVSALLVPGSSGWIDGAQKLASMAPQALMEVVRPVLFMKSGHLSRLYDFVAFSEYLTPDFSGPVVMACRKILQGLPRQRLGQYEWLLQKKSFLELYYLIQAQVAVARGLRRLLEDAMSQVGQRIAEEQHVMAYQASVLCYSARRHADRGVLPREESELLPSWEGVLDLASPEAWGVLYLMDENLAGQYLRHFFDVYRGTHDGLPRLLLRELIRYSSRFERDMEKMNEVQRLKKLSRNGKGHRIFALQRAAVLEDPLWGAIFAHSPGRWEEYLKIWWASLDMEIKGYGAAFILSEKRWERRVLGYDPYINRRRYGDLVEPFFRESCGLIKPVSFGDVALPHRSDDEE